MVTTDGRIVRVLVPIGNGSEEIETTGITETLSRFGANVVIASVTGDKIVKMSQGLEIMANIEIKDAEYQKWDLIACPGGMQGAISLKESKVLIRMLRLHNIEKRLIGAICATPAVVLPEAGIVVKGATCYPSKSLRDMIPNVSNQDVVVQDNIVTAAGPGTTLMFALTLGRLLFGQQKTTEIARSLLVYRGDKDDYVYNITDKTKRINDHRYMPPNNKKTCYENNTQNNDFIVNSDIFIEIIWPKLEEKGFTMETRNQGNDYYFFPPKVDGKSGILNKDYFDSILGILSYLQSDSKFGYMFKLYDTCVQIYEIEKSKNSLPEEFSQEWLEHLVVITYPSFQSLYNLGF